MRFYANLILSHSIIVPFIKVLPYYFYPTQIFLSLRNQHIYIHNDCLYIHTEISLFKQWSRYSYSDIVIQTVISLKNYLNYSTMENKFTFHNKNVFSIFLNSAEKFLKSYKEKMIFDSISVH